MTLFTKKENEITGEVKAAEEKTLGARIAEARKGKALTQEDFAGLLGVTAQAVSKWENDISCPDIMLLPKISEFFGISIDELLTGNTKKEEKTEKSKVSVTDTSKLKLRIQISPPNKKPTNVTIPVTMVKKVAKIGNGISAIIGNNSISNERFEEILELAEQGAIGEFLNIDTDDGTKIILEIR